MGDPIRSGSDYQWAIESDDAVKEGHPYLGTIDVENPNLSLYDNDVRKIGRSAHSISTSTLQVKKSWPYMICLGTQIYSILGSSIIPVNILGHCKKN